jgi:hypothetical protein
VFLVRQRSLAAISSSVKCRRCLMAETGEVQRSQDAANQLRPSGVPERRQP